MTEKEHMHFERPALAMPAIKSPYVRSWMELVEKLVHTLPKGQPVQTSGMVAEQQVLCTVIEDGECLVIGSQVTDEYRVLIGLREEASATESVRLEMKVTHYYPGRARKPKSDAREVLQMFAKYTYTPDEWAEALTKLANIAFLTISHKGFPRDIVFPATE